MSLNSESIVVRRKDQVSSKLDDEVVMMSIENGKYYGIDKIGSRIWELLEEPHALGELCSILSAEYHVDAEQCLTDVTPFIEELIKEGLAETADEQAS